MWCVGSYDCEMRNYRSAQGFANLLSRISRMSGLSPIAVTVTWGAGGSTRERSLDLAEVTQTEHGIDTILHLTCTNMEQGLVDDVLRVCCLCFHLGCNADRFQKAKEKGIENILALRGGLRFILLSKYWPG